MHYKNFRNKHFERKKRIVFVLSCIVTFLTVYSLVLPAVTIDKESAEEDNGIVLKDGSDSSSVQESLDTEDNVPFYDNIQEIQAEDSSVFSVANSETKEFSELLKEEQEKEKQMANKVSYPAVSFSDTLNDTIVHVSASEGAFPEGTTMKIEEVEYDVSDSISEVVDSQIVSYKAIDISFYDGEKKIEPERPIEVSITSNFISEEPKDPLLVHINDEGKTDLVETKPKKDQDIEAISNDEEIKELVENNDHIEEITADNTLSFESNAFSVYVLVYTVDFHNEVDGKTYDFSIPGGGFTTLGQIAETLKLVGTNEDINMESDGEVISEADDNGDTFDENCALSETAKQFVLNVANVEFSDPDLVWIGKANNATTIGELKTSNGLEIQYSAELTEEQIKEFDATTINSGDWALLTLKPFDTEETLTITMNDGQMIKIIVTDAQEDGDVVGADALRTVEERSKRYTVNKVWVDQAGAVVTEGIPENITLTLSRDREKLYETVNLIVRKNDGDMAEFTRVENIYCESKVTLAYEYNDSQNYGKYYTFNGQRYSLPSNKTNGTFDISIPYGATSPIYLEIGSDWGSRTVESVSVKSVQEPSSSVEPDEAYTLPIELTASDNWEKSIELPIVEKTADGVIYEYMYDIAETAVEGGTVSGHNVSAGEKVFVWTSDLAEDSMTVTNTEKGDTTSVSASKIWGANTEPAHAVQFTLYSEVTAGTAGSEQIGTKYYKQVTLDAAGNPVEPKVITAIQSGDSYTWPTGEENKATWDNLPIARNGVNVQYLIKETGVYEGYLTADGKVPEGATWSSVRGFRIAPAEGADVAQGGIVNFTNTLQGQDVKIDKTWDENVKSNMAWESTFVLEELEYPYADQNGHVTYDPDKAHDDAEHSGTWTEVVPRTEWTISSSSSPQELTLRGLPKFRTKDDGKVYILMYSVTETGYKVWDNPNKTGNPIYSWTKGGSYIGDIHFTPEYLEDADEYTDYTIEVRNTKRNEKEAHFIDFDLKKTWTPANEQIDQASDSYAVFQLKRQSHQEFKKMNDPEVDYETFVTVRVVDAGGRELTSLQVEKNAEIKLQAGFKAGVDGIGTVDFINLDGTTGHVMIENPTALTTQELKSSRIFRVSADATFQYNAGEEYLADGLHGIVISDNCDGTPTADVDDAEFNNLNLRYRIDKDTGRVITYSNGTINSVTNGNGWTLDFQDFPQQLIDSGETRETTTVYGYYFEEVERYPEYAVTYYQADSEGNKTNVVNGDINNRIYFNDHVIAENKKTHLTIKKYWESLVQSEMPNLVVDIKQVETDGNNVNVNAGSPSFKKVILTPENNFEYELYNLVVRRQGGYYAYVPWELGFTTSKPGDDGVAADGTITDESKVTYTALSNQYFDSLTYAAAKEGSSINYMRIKADNLARTNFTELSDKYDIITTGSGTICIVNNPKKTGFQLAIRKRWHKFTAAGGMTTESNYDGAYFTAMMVQIVKDASTGEEISRHDFGSTFEWHYDGNTDFKYKDQGKESNVSIRYSNGQWLVVIPEGQGNDGSNLPRYGYYTKTDGSIGVAEYDYTVRELSVTSMDGYHWAISDHIQAGSAQDLDPSSGVSGNGHIWMLDNYPDADLKIIKHWPSKSTNQGAHAVYFLITDQNGKNVLDDIVESKKYKEHDLTAGDVAQYNGQWCLVVRGPVNSTEDWIGYINHLPLFDFSHTTFGDGEIMPGGMPGEINYNVKEVAALNSEGTLVDSSGLYIPYYQVTTRGTKDSIRASAEGIQLGMYDIDPVTGKETLQPTIVEVTNNATTDLEVEKRFYDVNDDGDISVVNPADMTAWITEDGGKIIKEIDYIVKVDTYEGENTEPTPSLSGYLTENWKQGQELADESGAKVFTLSVEGEPQSDSSGVYWSDKPDALKGLPSVRIINNGTKIIVRRYAYSIIEKGIYAVEGTERIEISKFIRESTYDRHKEVWKLSNTRSKNEYTDFEFTKEWRTMQYDTSVDWPEDKEIFVQVIRTKNGAADDEFKLNFKIDSTNKESTEGIPAEAGSLYPEGSAPVLNYQPETKYTYKVSNLLKKAGSDVYEYYITETVSVDGYMEPRYYDLDENGQLVEKETGAANSDRINNGGKIVNKENYGVELPSTGGPGTNLIHVFGFMLASLAGVGLLMNRWKRNVHKKI